MLEVMKKRERKKGEMKERDVFFFFGVLFCNLDPVLLVPNESVKHVPAKSHRVISGIRYPTSRI